MIRAGAAVLILAVACSGPQEQATGVVVAVDGGLDVVTGFAIVTTTGDRLVFAVAPGLDQFEHGGPVSHLHEHLQTGIPVVVTYESADGVLTAVAVDG